MAAAFGLEPKFPISKTGVLPLNDTAKKQSGQQDSNLHSCTNQVLTPGISLLLYR